MVSWKLKRQGDRLLCIFDDGTVSIEDVIGIYGDELETSNRVLSVSELDKFVDVSGCVFYATNLNVSSRIESENLKMLRRSIVLKNIFDYQGKKDMDVMKFLPWVIVLVAIIFR